MEIIINFNQILWNFKKSDVSPNIMAVPQSYHQISANSLRFMMHDAILGATDESPQKRQPQRMTSNLAKAFTFYISYFHHIFFGEALIVCM